MIRCHVGNRQLEAQSSGSVSEMVQVDRLNARAIETCPPFEGPESSDNLLPALPGLQAYSLCLLWSPDSLFDPPHHHECKCK